MKNIQWLHCTVAKFSSHITAVWVGYTTILILVKMYLTFKLSHLADAFIQSDLHIFIQKDLLIFAYFYDFYLWNTFNSLVNAVN